MKPDESEAPQAPGWEAIDRALKAIYPDQTPRHFGTLISYELGGPDPLKGISAYYRATPVPHWHMVTYGFSELFEKKSEAAETSGYGIELTFRLKGETGMDEPPPWTLNFLQNLARYVFQTGNVFKAGDYMSLNGPINVEAATHIHSMALVPDPELPSINTPNGRVEFLQVVGITMAEQQVITRWIGLEVMNAFSARLPLYITDLDRACLTADDEIMAAVEAGSSRDGSATGVLFVDQLEWTSTKPWFGPRKHGLTLGALQVADIVAILPLRLGFGHSLMLISEEAQIVFEPWEEPDIREDQGVLKIGLPETAWQSLVNVLRPRAGSYSVPELPDLSIEVLPTHIKNQEGEIERTVG